MAEPLDADAGQAGSVDAAGEQQRGLLGWEGGAVGAGEAQVVILLVGGPDGTGGEPFRELPSVVVVEDGHGAGIERDGPFAVATVVEEGDELVTAPAVVSCVARPGASGLGRAGEVGDVAGQVAAGHGRFERDVQAAVGVADALGAQPYVQVRGARPKTRS